MVRISNNKTKGTLILNINLTLAVNLAYEVKQNLEYITFKRVLLIDKLLLLDHIEVLSAPDLFIYEG
jgi:hypothetical protein